MPSRRGFLRWAAAAAAAAGVPAVLARAAWALEGTERKRALEKPLPRSDLGRTGRSVARVGLGCFYLGNLTDERRALAVVARALELGVDYFDVAPSYNRGVAESRLGKALRGARDRVFLATKSTRRDGEGARRELEESLERLGTDRVDLFQFHALKTAADAEEIFAEDGAWAALAKAREEGKVRHLGFSGHFDPALHREVIEGRPMETVLMPLNCVDRHEKSFEEGALPAARKQGIGIVGMKVFASGNLLKNPALAPTPEECLRYTLSLPVDTAIVGCSSVEELEVDLALAKTFEPFTKEERAALVKRTEPFVPKRIEWYKR